MQNTNDIVMSGIRSTGFLHLGNYFGAIKNYVRMQDQYRCFFMVADLHSLTTHPDTSELKSNVQRVLAENIACGLDPEKVVLYCQSHVPETAEIYLFLNMLAYKGELEKTTTFKDKARQHPDNINAGLLTYPVLMTSDILLHRASLVPVGKDQEQHLEMARNFAHRFNHRYGTVFPEPHAFNYGHGLVKVPALDGSGKMSKSENPNATIFLSDEDDLIHKKIMKAPTDTVPTHSGSAKTPNVANLFLLLELVSTTEMVKKFDEDYQNGSIRYGDLKKQLAEDMILLVKPIREKSKLIFDDKEYLKQIMANGAAKARESARHTLDLVKSTMRLDYF